MIDRYKVVIDLMQCFPRHSFLNERGEFIAHREANEYFNLDACYTELDVKCKILEQLSRGAYKTRPFHSEKKNDNFHKFMRDGINKYLGTSFSEDDMEVIYTYLGNGCNRQKTILFIQSGYDISILER